MSEFEATKQATIEAIRAALLEAYQEVNPSDLFGFALCFDEDVETVYHVYATRGWVAEHESDYPEIGLIPVEWLQRSSDALFLPLSQRVKVWAKTDPRSGTNARVVEAERVEALVQALEVCRAEQLFDERTLVVLCAVDAADRVIIELEAAAARRLNPADLAAVYCEAR